MKTLIIPNDHISKVCNLLNQLIGDVTSKNLFTGYGLFYKEKDVNLDAFLDQPLTSKRLEELKGFIKEREHQEP